LEVDCDADLIQGYDWLRTHDLVFLDDSDEVCLCARSGCTSGRPIRLDLTLDAPISPATSLSPAEARALLGAVGLGDVPTLGRPSLWRSPGPRAGGRSSAVATLAAAATAAWAEDTLASLADTGTTLADGTELLVGHIAFAADGPACTLPADDGDPPDFAGEYADVLTGPPPGLPPDRAPALELRIESQCELDECRKQVAHLLDQGRRRKRIGARGRANHDGSRGAGPSGPGAPRADVLGHSTGADLRAFGAAVESGPGTLADKPPFA